MYFWLRGQKRWIYLNNRMKTLVWLIGWLIDWLVYVKQLHWTEYAMVFVGNTFLCVCVCISEGNVVLNYKLSMNNN